MLRTREKKVTLCGVIGGTTLDSAESGSLARPDYYSRHGMESHVAHDLQVIVVLQHSNIRGMDRPSALLRTRTTRTVL